MIAHFLNYFIGSFFISVATYYVAVKITDEKFDLFNLKVFKFILLEAFVLMFLYVVAPNNLFRLVINSIIFVITFWRIFRYNIFYCVVLSFLIFSIIIFSETLFVILNIIIFKIDEKIIRQIYFMNIISNFIISIIMVLFIKIPFVAKFSKNLCTNIRAREHLNIVIIFLSSVLCISVLLYYIYFDVNLIIGLLINFFLILCYILLPITILKEKKVNLRLKFEYDTILKNMEVYENDLAEQRMKNHENRNILFSIKGMIDKKDSYTRDFINKVLNVTNNEDMDILSITNNIPIGGLQGLIYQKLLFMKKNNINYFINIDRKIKRNMFINVSSNLMRDICMITGVFIDNSLQEVQDKSAKVIGIQMYKSNEFIIIEISNNYTKNMDVSLFDVEGFTTKNKGHGYGLSLVKKIISKNKNLKNIREINGNIFIQKLIIKI